ncbi:MAG: hypothetical protein JST86_21115 [Bacteroidetes bacterium]|nr:hypothetical protein [Bacteroidota bacterium]
MTDIGTAKLDEYRYECRSWQRLLDFFKQENAFLKTRLSEVVDGTSDRDFLALAEHFQNQFIIKDEFMDELKHDVNEMENSIKAVRNKQKPFSEKVESKQNKLRNEIDYLEKSFLQLKNEFNRYQLSLVDG